MIVKPLDKAPLPLYYKALIQSRLQGEVRRGEKILFVAI